MVTLSRLGSAAVLVALALGGCARKPVEIGNKTNDGRLAPLLKNLGKLHAPVTTKSADAQRFFNQGLTLVYGFNHAEALRSFKEAARLDPRLAMAHWGQALALAPNINDSAIGADREQQGYAAIAEAVKLRAHAGAGEQAMIDALAARFSDRKADRAALNKAYANAMTNVNAAYGDDPDVAALYADAVMNTMPWDYWTKDGKPKPGVAEARAALEKTIRNHPDHPGARHFYIHLLEASDDVDKAVESADRLGELVPAAGHLVHMPAHIYIRTGRYDDAAQANVRAISADEDYITQCRAQGIYPAAYYPHNIHFLNAVVAMDGRSKEALESARKVASQHDHGMMSDPTFGFGHLLKTIPYTTLVRFGRWDEIMKEPEPPADQIFGRAIRHFARGFALSAKGKPAEAKAELGMLRKLAAEPSLEQTKILDLNPLAKLASIAQAMLEGDIAQKAGRHNDAIGAFRRAVATEDGLLYSEPPDWMLPPLQYLGDAYLKAGRAADAERAFREDLRRHRQNGWSLFGLELALRKQGKTQEASNTRQAWGEAWTRSDVVLVSSRF